MWGRAGSYIFFCVEMSEWGGSGSYFGEVKGGGAQRNDHGILLSYSCDQICVQICEILPKKCSKIEVKILVVLISFENLPMGLSGSYSRVLKTHICLHNSRV